MSRGLLVLGTDTGVGKTVVSAALMAAAPKATRYWKPVQTGAMTPDDADDDTGTVQRLTGLTQRRILPPGVRLPVPASPHFAARAAGQELTMLPLLTRWQAIQSDAGFDLSPDPGPMVVEGAGGLLVPLSETVLMTELWRALDLPVLIVARSALGTINHTLLTLRMARVEGLRVLGITLVGPPDESARSALHAFADAPILAELPRLEALTPTAVAALGATLLAAAPIAQALR